jgi:pimeloyl-ACP methyl ester carboxylesterase
MPVEGRAFVVEPQPWLRGETRGEGPPVVLCHGITATRRYVLGDLERVIAAQVGEERFVLGGHSMGAHTAVAYALRNPQRLAGLVVIGPVYVGEIRPESLAYWDGLAAALENGGVDGFVAYIGAKQGADPRWRDSVLRFTRERILLQQDPAALAQALREVSRSRPFESLGELDAIDVPALVVASNDDADPGHPFEAAAAYAEALPRARLVSEAEGESPLAWQGGKLSREIAAFCAEITGAGV